LRHDDTAFEQQAADLIYHARAKTDEARAHTMEGLEIALFGGFNGNEAHRRALDSFDDGFRIAVVVLVTLEKRLHVLRRNKSHVVTKREQSSGDVMRACAGLHADQAPRHISQPLHEL
jgi:hypothetical protein